MKDLLEKFKTYSLGDDVMDYVIAANVLFLHNMIFGYDQTHMIDDWVWAYEVIPRLGIHCAQVSLTGALPKCLRSGDPIVLQDNIMRANLDNSEDGKDPNVLQDYQLIRDRSPNTPCNDGVLITYNHTTTEQIAPFLSPADRSNQPYRFESTLTVLNNGRWELKNWRVFVGFEHGELLVSAKNAVLADGDFLPANVSGGAVLSGSSVTDLKTAIETAGDIEQMQAVVELVGTEFGVAPPNFSLPGNITLANDGYLCQNLTKQGSAMSICCTADSNTRTNITLGEEFSPLEQGDLTIMYDVVMTYDINYFARVTISNHNPFGRLDNWKLSWEWMGGEFIRSMRGAYPDVVDTGDCIFGSQGQADAYKSFDFSKVLSCDRNPTIVDLPLSMANDTNLGFIPFCCRNGTILSPSMDITKSNSSFQIEVFKMPPDLNKTELSPPLNWRINSSIGPDYQCTQPIRVAPSLFPDPSGLPSQTEAVASWQVVCNTTKVQSRNPSCCVTFSSFFNDSVIPCNTCACGCDSRPTGAGGGTCSATAPAVLLPAQALLVPFDNRTKLIETFAHLKRHNLPNPLPCPDNCGVSINWHLLSDFEKGWTARVTLFNWGDADIADWFASVELVKAMPGYEKAYSMDGKVLSDPNNDTLFLQGLSGLNYLVAERNGSNPRKDPPVPGSQQTVISFTKKQTPGIRVARGDGFPTKVYFTGEECSLPTMLPSNARRVAAASAVFTGILSLLLVFILAGM
ncbi:COBRA-like protein-7 precursor [Perilla frutescens var. hirtella]|uniref:COBRA-like protein-7 n=1 Tax=Perilla frutescens var. hirtella TaxID=608512 RepID=A0AAD4IM42_PERFH|nr:COBRA-like protein-7 precursor [Perilla frutescens var. hirtella]